MSERKTSSGKERSLSRSSSKHKGSRPSSGVSKASKGSGVQDTVTKLTIKALKDFKLDDEVEGNEEDDVVDDVDEIRGGTATIDGVPNATGSIDIGSRGRVSGEMSVSGQPGSVPGGSVPGSDGGDFQDFRSLPTTQDVDETTAIAEGNDEEIQDSGMDAGIETDSEDDGENDLIVLDPDHPLMKRFQNTYKTHLFKQDEKVTLELRELNEEYTYKKKAREERGVELYGIQQELARQQMKLEKDHDIFNEEGQFRKKCEGLLSEVKTMYKQNFEDFNKQRKRASELQMEVENLAAKLRYMETAKEGVRSDIAIMKGAAEKSDYEVGKAEEEKRKQDLLVDTLIQRVEHLREDITMYETQLSAQREETKAALKTLTEASTELEAIQLEKKQLLQQWNSSLIGMRRRDEAYAAMQEAVSLQNQRIMAIETELEGYKRQIKKAQEQNEQLTYMQNRIETDILNVKKQFGISQNKHEALKIEYSTYSRALHETEQQLNRSTTEVTLKENESTVLRKQIEREFLEKVKLEDLIMEKMREQLTSEKASQYTKKMTDKVRRRATELERSMADVENEISKDILDIANATSRVRRLQENLDGISNEIHQKNDTISQIEKEGVRKNAVIEKKQGTIDQYNKKVDQILTKEGSEDYTGPLEFQVKTLQKQIDAKMNECLELQQFWLRQQSELVKMIKDVQQQSGEIRSLKKHSTILLQKKLRMEGEIDSQQNEIDDLQRNVRGMQQDMTKLNMLIHKNKDKKENLQQDNILMESDFIQTLREAEYVSVNMESTIGYIKEEKERLLNALLEAERQIMLWEKKTQLAREAKHAVDSEVGQGEIRAMKAEIHRMEVRLAQLMRQQEKMIQDMEKSVFRRECIIVRGDAQAKMGKIKDTKGSFHKKQAELKKKIKQTSNDANSCDDDIRQLRESLQLMSKDLEDKQTTEHQLQMAIDDIEAEIDHLSEARHRNLADIVSRQQRSKYYSSLKDGKYTLLCKSPKNLDSDTQKHRDRFQSLLTIVDRLNVEYPDVQTALRRITLSLGNKGISTPRDPVQ